MKQRFVKRRENTGVFPVFVDWHGHCEVAYQQTSSPPTNLDDLKTPMMRRAQLTREIMLTYKKLSTEKYWKDSVKQELKAYRKLQNRDAIRSLFQFVFAAAMILFVMFAVETMPIWLPTATDYVTAELDRVNSFMQAQSTGAIATSAAAGN